MDETSCTAPARTTWISRSTVFFGSDPGEYAARIPVFNALNHPEFAIPSRL